MICVIGDLQIQAPSAFNYKNEAGHLGNYVLEGALNALAHIFNYCVIDHEIKDVIIAGDIFEKKDELPNYIKNATKRLIERYNEYLNFTIVEGNHDKNPEGHSTIEWLEGYGFKIITEPDILTIDNQQVAILPYSKDIGYLIDVLQDVSFQQCDLLCGHFDVANARISLSSRLKKGVSIGLFKPFKKVYLGHIHIGQEPADNVYIIGSTYQTDWGEIDKKHFVVHDVSSTKLVKIPLFLERQIIPIITPEDLNVLKPVNDNVIVRIDLPYSNNSWVEEIKKKLQCKLVQFNWLDLDAKMPDGTFMEKEMGVSVIQQYFEKTMSETTNYMQKLVVKDYQL